MKQCGHPLVDKVDSTLPASVYGICRICEELVVARWGTHTEWLAEDRLREKLAEEKKCQHKGSERISLANGQLTHTGDFRCAKCGVKLTPTWGVE